MRNACLDDQEDAQIERANLNGNGNENNNNYYSWIFAFIAVECFKIQLIFLTKFWIILPQNFIEKYFLNNSIVYFELRKVKYLLYDFYFFCYRFGENYSQKQTPSPETLNVNFFSKP